MSETKPIPVRLLPSVIDRLDAASLKMRTNRAALVRLLTDTFQTDYEVRGNITLPLDWEALINRQDGRRKNYDLQSDIALVVE